jgi:hypothetical protein
MHAGCARKSRPQQQQTATTPDNNHNSEATLLRALHGRTNPERAYIGTYTEHNKNYEANKVYEVLSSGTNVIGKITGDWQSQ